MAARGAMKSHLIPLMDCVGTSKVLVQKHEKDYHRSFRMNVCFCNLNPKGRFPKCSDKTQAIGTAETQKCSLLSANILDSQ